MSPSTKNILIGVIAALIVYHYTMKSTSQKGKR